jgi:hypothetical protein
MPIIAENKGGGNFAPMPQGNYVARCYSMIQIGTVEGEYLGEKTIAHKVRLTFEFPTELKVFKEENGEQPYVLSKEFTLSMHEKSSLRKFLESWRGKSFSELEVKAFDITALIGKSCMVNVVHKEDKKGNNRADISSVGAMPKGLVCPPQINETQLLAYDNFDLRLFESLPDFLKDKIKSSREYRAMQGEVTVFDSKKEKEEDSLPF